MTQNLIDLNLNRTNLETLRTWLCNVSKDKDLTVKMRVSTPHKTRKKIDCFKADGFCALCNTVFETMGCFYLYCPCQEAQFSLIAEDIERGNRKREMDQMRKQYTKEKRYTVVEMWESEWWNLYKTF